MAHPKTILLSRKPSLTPGRDRGSNMRHELKEEHTLACSGRIVLVCKKCGENTILLWLEEDWRSERTDFTCGCGKNLTLADRESEEVRSVRKLIRGATRPTSKMDEGYQNPEMYL